MSISISNYPVHLQDGFKPNRECLKSQGSQSEYQKVFHTLENLNFLGVENLKKSNFQKTLQN